LVKKPYFLFAAAALFALGVFLAAQESAGPEGAGPNARASHPETVRWYRSNASGLAIELIPSRLAAMRNEYCLSVETIGPEKLPGIIPRNIISYYEEGYSVEFRLLYESAKETRRQWIFRDGKGLGRLAASGTADFFSSANRRGNEGEDDGEVNRKGFIEIRDSEGFVTREFQYDEDLSEWDFRYYYREGILIRAETWLKGPPLPPSAVKETGALEEEDEDDEGDEDETSDQVAAAAAEIKGPVLECLFTDYYRYSRSGSLRAIDRTIHEGEGERSRVGFPALSPRIAPANELATEAGVYTSEYFLGAGSLEGLTISYNLDSRGRVLGETLKDGEGKTVGELRNNWSGNRLQNVLWKSGDDERRVEFEYDKDGNPTAERNFRKGVLERAVKTEGGTEVEEIYMGGVLILRAYWANGLKISEEWISSGGLPGENPRENPR
jgi:hypothetical protein